MLKLITSGTPELAFAELIASRCDPGPLSIVVVTVNVAAQTGLTVLTVDRTEIAIATRMKPMICFDVIDTSCDFPELIVFISVFRFQISSGTTPTAGVLRRQQRRSSRSILQLTLSVFGMVN